MSNSQQIQVLWSEISILKNKEDDYISLTDIARYKNPTQTGLVISHWLSTKYTVEFMWVREKLHNPDFNITEFSNIKNQSGTNWFVLSVSQRKEKTNALWIFAKTGRYGSGTFAHKDIAFEFWSWISPEFKMYLIKEFQRLKQQEMKSLDWDVKRFLTKVNYRIHTDAIKENLIPQELSQEQIHFIYADEADVLNKSLFWLTAKEWREQNSSKKCAVKQVPLGWNIRDHASIEQLIILANMESINAEFINMWYLQAQRLKSLNKTAITQMKSLLNIWISNRILAK